MNSASDDAAGLAIADTLSAKSKVYTRAVKNVNDGISVISIADAAIGALSDITTRIVELAEQSANGTYTNTQREAMDKEAQALSKEYFRISRSTSFNSIRLFDGSMQGLSLQAGEGTAAVLASSLGGKMGTGAFAQRSDFAAAGGTYCVNLGDLNSDGILDMVTANASGSASLFLGRGDGSFGARTNLVTGSGTLSNALGDLNGDGVLDIVASNAGADSVSVLLNNKDGTYLARTFTTGDAPYSIALGDLNNDGILDVVTANHDAGTASVLLGQGDGNFSSQTSFATGALTNSVTLGDLNRDGIVDMVTANNGGNASVLLGRGDGTFGAQTAFATGAGVNQVALGDLNGDGVLDMVTANSSDGNASVLLGKGDGTFGAQTTFVTGATPRSIGLGDLNGDGTLDAVTANSGGSVSVLLGKGDGTFETRTSTAAGGGSRSVSLGDLNGDGVLDIATANSTANTASVLIGETREGLAPILPFSLRTKADALQALMPMKQKLDSLATQRGVLGAFEARLSAAAANLFTSVENFRAAESRIRDSDVATDAAEMTRLQILQSAGASVLGQANQQPDIALTLLRQA